LQVNIASVLKPRQRKKALSHRFLSVFADQMAQNASISQIRQRKTGHVAMAG
jgi:hypothetical protein